jgi:signal peptidase II
MDCIKPSRLLRTATLAGIIVSTIGCDQVSKHIARTHLPSLPPLVFLGGSVRIALAQNDGGLLSIGSSLSPGLRTTVFLVGVAVGLLLAAVYLIRASSLRFPALLCAWFVWTGGLSNLVDRILFGGRVTDFVVVGLGPLHTGVFNVADVAITAGAVGLILSASSRQPDGFC